MFLLPLGLNKIFSTFFRDDIVARPVEWLECANCIQESEFKAEADRYQIRLSVKDFSPEEISVKAVDGFVVVEGKYEKKKDEHGIVSREFRRRYALPEGSQAEAVESRMSSDGVLTITVPWIAAPDIMIPVTYEQCKAKSKL